MKFKVDVKPPRKVEGTSFTNTTIDCCTNHPFTGHVYVCYRESITLYFNHYPGDNTTEKLYVCLDSSCLGIQQDLDLFCFLTF